MSTINKWTAGIPQERQQYLKRHRGIALALPAPGTVHTSDDLPQVISNDLVRCVCRGVLTRIHKGRDNDSDPRRYAVDDQTYHWVQANIEAGPWPDCPHAGLQNLRGDVFSCGNPDCDARYNREEAAAAMEAMT